MLRCTKAWSFRNFLKGNDFANTIYHVVYQRSAEMDWNKCEESDLWSLDLFCVWKVYLVLVSACDCWKCDTAESLVQVRICSLEMLLWSYQQSASINLKRLQFSRIGKLTWATTKSWLERVTWRIYQKELWNMKNLGMQSLFCLSEQSNFRQAFATIVWVQQEGCRGTAINNLSGRTGISSLLTLCSTGNVLGRGALRSIVEGRKCVRTKLRG